MIKHKGSILPFGKQENNYKAHWGSNQRKDTTNYIEYQLLTKPSHYRLIAVNFHEGEEESVCFSGGACEAALSLTVPDRAED